jgi:RimJ/RimL family protein N-acetyltransferase
MLEPEQIRDVIGERISHYVGPMYEGYAEGEGISSSRITCVIALDRSYIQDVQAFAAACERSAGDVTPIWRDVLHRFISIADPTEFEHSGLARADSPLFAVVDASRVLALAHYSMWAADAASIGVLTHPEHRGGGHGKAAVCAAMADAFSHGHLVLYRTCLANRASVALAESVGCHDYGRFLAVHLQAAG